MIAARNLYLILRMTAVTNKPLKTDVKFCAIIKFCMNTFSVA